MKMNSPVSFPCSSDSLLTELEFSHVDEGRNSWYRYLCKCGNTKVLREYSVRIGNTRSCGCLNKKLSAERMKERNTTHGHCRDEKESKTYRSWSNMKSRCQDLSSSRYGGRGITYDSKWETFEGFLDDMGESPGRGHALDRIDNDGNYCKDNCCWISRSENSKKMHRDKKKSKEALDD